jgi:hypothetical protein
VDFVKNLGLRAGKLAAQVPKIPRLPPITLHGNLVKVTGIRASLKYSRGG